MADPLACKQCATYYREHRQEWLQDRQISEGLHSITVESYNWVADLIEVDSPLMARRARVAAQKPFDRAAYMNARIADYHDHSHVPRGQRETVDDHDPT